MYDYICKKCNSNIFYAKEKIMTNGNKHIGLYCKNCNKWYKWISILEYNKIIESR